MYTPLWTTQPLQGAMARHQPANAQGVLSDNPLFSGRGTLVRARPTVAAIAVACLALAACGSPSTGGGGGAVNPGPSDKELIIGMINPFSGTDAAFGLDMNAGCVAAVQVINAHGGALGHTFKCVPIDSKGDAADAVPAVTKALGQYSNMVGVIGPGTDAATATMPLLEQAQMATIGANGDVSFNQNTYKYYWRITPSDTGNAVGMVVAAKNLGFKRAALVFGNDAGAQTSVPGHPALLAQGRRHDRRQRVAGSQPAVVPDGGCQGCRVQPGRDLHGDGSADGRDLLWRAEADGQAGAHPRH